jgi:hypothetical protein
MRFDATEEQRQLQKITRRFLEDTAPLTCRAALGEKSPAGFDRDWWRRAADLGWTSLLVPESRGGSARDGAGVTGLANWPSWPRSGDGWSSPGPLLPTSVAAWTLAQADPDADVAATLEAIGPERRCAPGWSERATARGWSAPAGARRATRGGSLELTGTARAIEAGADATASWWPQAWAMPWCISSCTAEIRRACAASARAASISCAAMPTSPSTASSSRLVGDHRGRARPVRPDPSGADRQRHPVRRDGRCGHPRLRTDPRVRGRALHLRPATRLIRC